MPAKLTWGGATAKFNTRKIYLEGSTAKFNTRETYLEGATAKFNTRETQKFRGFLEQRNLVPAKFSTFKVTTNVLTKKSHHVLIKEKQICDFDVLKQFSHKIKHLKGN